jgi:hypothetical protein
MSGPPLTRRTGEEKRSSSNQAAAPRTAPQILGETNDYWISAEPAFDGRTLLWIATDAGNRVLLESYPAWREAQRTVASRFGGKWAQTLLDAARAPELNEPKRARHWPRHDSDSPGAPVPERSASR